jgi:hypothetical protein
MLSSRDYRQLLVKIGKASLTREIRSPPKPEFPVRLIDAVIISSLAVSVLVGILLAIFS